jgi:hypothetical protein
MAFHTAGGTAMSHLASRRRGTSLVELLVVLFLMTTVFGLIAGISRQLFLAERASRAATVRWPAIADLATRFRSDVHTATSGSLIDDEGQPGMELSLSENGKVVYGLADGHMQRLETDAKGIEGRDTYRLPEGSSVTWTIRDEPTKVAVMSLALPKDSRSDADEFPLVIHIEANLGVFGTNKD